MGKQTPELGCYSNDQLDAFLDLRHATQEHREVPELIDLYNQALELGVLPEVVWQAITESTDQEFADRFLSHIEKPKRQKRRK